MFEWLRLMDPMAAILLMMLFIAIVVGTGSAVLYEETRDEHAPHASVIGSIGTILILETIAMIFILQYIHPPNR